MRMAKFHFGTALLVGMMWATAAGAQTGLPTSDAVEQWMKGPEQHLPGWNVQVHPPALTFRLRYAVSVHATANIAKAHLAGHDLHVFLRVTESKGWQSIVRHSSMNNLPNKADLEVSEDFFAEPGAYRIVIVLYDLQARAHGTWFKSVEVPGGESLPAYANAPPVDFIDDDGPFFAEVSPVVQPIDNPYPKRVDIVLNLTERSELEMSRDGSPHHRRFHAPGSASPDWTLDRPPQEVASEAVLSMGELLASWRLDGCVRVSAFDAIHAKTYLDRASSLDPGSLLKELQRNRDVAQVDAHTLTLRLKSGDFVRSFVQQIIDDHSGCDSVTAPAARMIIVISDELIFPEGEQLQSAEPALGDRTRFYLLRLAIPDPGSQFHYDYVSGRGMRMAGGRFDEVPLLMQDLHPQRFDITKPRDFQKALSHLAAALRE